MDSNEDDVKEFDPEECDQKCKQFAEITGTDSALGHYFLQDCEWNLDKALNRFFESGTNDRVSERLKQPEGIEEFVIMSWNVDGLDDKNRRSRTEAVCNVIKQDKPAFVFLQEVVPETLAIIDNELKSDYSVTAPSCCNQYFTALLLNTKLAKKISYNLIEFPNTQMLRDLLQVEVEIENKSIVLLTTHLESTKDFKSSRMRQFQTCMEALKKVPYSKAVIFGGDLNIRDDEVTGKPDDVVDVWEATGSNLGNKFTWDCLQNDNLQRGIDGGAKFKPRCRFDRLYFRDSQPTSLQLCDFKLTGKQRIRSCLCFPSDHWALRCIFKIRK